MEQADKSHRRKKRVMPKWSSERSRRLVFNNKMRVYKTIHNKRLSTREVSDW